MADKLQVTIVGLGLLGASAGLALRRYADKVTVVGHDRETEAAAAARKAGAIDRHEWNLISAVAGADRVLLALPAWDVIETLKVVAQDLQPGCVVVDTADVKAAVVEAAEALLPEGVHFVGGHPIVIAPPDEQAEPDPALFDRRLFCLTPSAGAAVDAVRLAADLVAALGAEPFFLDAGEHDSFAAAADHLPALLAGTLMRHASASPGWQDLRKVAGGQFFAATIVGGADGRAAAAALLANREALLARLDAYQAELAAWRGLVEAGDEASLAAQFELGSAARRGWLAAYETGDWEATPDAPPMPTSSSVFKGLFRIGPQRATPDPRKGK